MMESQPDPAQAQWNLYAHMNAMASLLENLIEKSVLDELGPADGRLYMQLCDTLNEYTKCIERSFRESNPESNADSMGDAPPDARSESD